MPMPSKWLQADPMTCGAYKMHPSPVIQVKAHDLHGYPSVWIPQNEVFRIQNIFEDQEYRIPPQYLPTGSLTIVDIGANVGLFALYMKHLRQDCDIYCFEPVPQTVELLKRNTEKDTRIHVYPCALSNREGLADLQLHPSNSGENSIIQAEAVPTCNSIQVKVEDAKTALSRIGITYIDILKIDTEGSEVEILESLRPYLPYVGVIMMEYHSEVDRRRIDDQLVTHLLFDAYVCKPHLGTVKYINARLI